MTGLYAIAATLGYLLVFWYLYVLVMAFYRAHLTGRLVGLVKWLAYPAVIVGILFDVVANVFIATIVFAELPREWLVTTRLTRHVKESTDWRYIRANWVCKSLLDVFDPTGNHCK